MEENKFEKWCKIKQTLEKNRKNNFHIRSREIWYINIWKNLWFESNWKWENFKRPVLVIKRIWSLFLIASMTTKWKDNNYYYKLDNKYFNKKSFITLSQIRVIDQKRFFQKIWTIDSKEFIQIKKEVKQLLF